MDSHVNINGALVQGDVRIEGPAAATITITNLPAGLVGVRGEPFPVIVAGRSGRGRLQGITWHTDHSATSTIAVDLDDPPTGLIDELATRR